MLTLGDQRTEQDDDKARVNQQFLTGTRGNQVQLKYLRINAFMQLKRPFSEWSRRRRTEIMLNELKITEGMSILDLGGTPGFWAQERIPPLNLTILNLPGHVHKNSNLRHAVRYMMGDACNVAELADGSFDVVFSNSVIEHVGDNARQAAFAKEVRRIGRSYWVQTPSIWFPIEAHTGMPFWWFYPAPVQRAIKRGWRVKLPAWTEMIDGTTVLTKSELECMFPDSRIIVERVCGVPKSYVAVKRRPDALRN